MDSDAKITSLRLAALPALVLLLCFICYPLVRMVGISLHLPDLSFADYFTAFNPVNRAIALRTFGLAATVTILALLVGYPAAAFLSRLNGTARTIGLVCVALPFLTSFLVRTYAWLVLFGDAGAINTLLMKLGIIDDPLLLLYTRAGMIVAMVHIMLPLMIFPIYASMRAIDPMQWRAAETLGGGPLRVFLTVYLPQTLAGVRSGCILVFIISLGFYITPQMLGSPSDLMLGSLIANNIENSLNFGFAAAVAVVLLAGTLLIFVLFGGNGAALTGAASSRGTWLGRLFRNASGLLPDGGNPAIRLSGWSWRRRAGKAAARSPARSGLPLTLFGVLVCIFLVTPSIVVVIAAFNGEESLSFPPRVVSTRWFAFVLSDPQWVRAMITSVKIACVSTILTLIVGTAAAFSITRLGGRREGSIYYGIALLPMIIPVIVTALGAFAVLSDLGLYGSQIGVILMHVCLSLPLVVVVMVAGFSGFDRRLELAAQSLGAGWLRIIRSVVAPLLMPSLVSAALFAFLHSFDEVIITSFIAGSTTTTVPVKMWENIRNQIDPAVAALSALLILLPFLVLAIRGLTVVRWQATRASVDSQQ